MSDARYSVTPSLRSLWAGVFLMGFAASGFFDGILLHQILQWHHLLSAMTVGVLGSLAGQVMFDGIFHALMYVVGLVGGYLIIRARRAGVTGAPGVTTDRLIAMFLLGFGVWHGVDAALSHWLLGIHRIRMDVPNPLTWDIAWLIVFGVIPLVVGALLWRRPASTSGGGRIVAVLAAGTVLAGLAGAMPLKGGYSDTITIVASDAQSIGPLLQQVSDAEGGVVWSDAAGQVWVVRAPPGSLSVLSLYRHGARYVSATLGGATCGGWVAI